MNVVMDAQSCAALGRATVDQARNQKRRQEGAAMTWTLTNFLIQMIAGIIGGHAIATVAKEHNFGALGHTVTGAVGGALSGYFLQILAATVVDSTGQINQDADQVTQWFIQALAGLVAGAVLTMAVGFVKYAIAQNRLGRG
jgi:uncharacterized membrane protein YeaQ/YmgE (transglycosylase-associated protein family)